MESIDDIRTAHCEGNTFCGYTQDEAIVSGGSDGDIRIYPDLFDDETMSVSVGSKITAFDVAGDLVLAANDVHEVKSFKSFHRCVTEQTWGADLSYIPFDEALWTELKLKL